MKTLATSIVMSLIFCQLAAAAVIVDFEDVPLAADSYYNGSDYAGSFTSGGVTFPVAYHDAGTYTWWEGIAASNMSDITTAGFNNMYSVYDSANNDNAFAVAGGGSEIVLPVATEVQSVYLNNTTYAALSMRDGDWFNDKFGGEDGTEADWFFVTLTGKDTSGSETGSVTFYLGDYRFADDSEDYIVDSWTLVDLTSLGDSVKTIEISFDSSDKGTYGINTPAYVALDMLSVSQVPEPMTITLLALGAAAALPRRRNS